MNQATVSSIYKELMRMNGGTEFVKFDLHIHSPASHDFTKPSGYSEKQCYETLLDNIANAGIEIVALTDHNTFEGYNTLIDIFEEDIALARKYRSNILVLCGIELTCFSKHLLAIFDVGFSKENQKSFLIEIGISNELIGSKDAVADMLGPASLIEKINSYGGFAILAHADTREGFMYSYCKEQGDKDLDFEFRGKSLSKILNSEALYGIQVTSKVAKEKVVGILNNGMLSKNKTLALLEFSDSHGLIIDGIYNASSGKSISSSYSIAKLSHKSFSSLRMVLIDPKVRLVEAIPQFDYPHILGCAIYGGFFRNTDKEYSLFKFNPEMNCIIGARGTGKSTLLGIIEEVLHIGSKEDKHPLRER